MSVLTGRIALVTGASRGIGRAVAEFLAAKGASVIAVARNAAALDELASGIAARGGQCRVGAFDITDMEQIDRLAHSIGRDHGRLDILIGNAGVFPGHFQVHELEPRVLRDTMQVNFFANWHLLRAFHELLRKSIAGRVIFVTSRGAYVADPGWFAYTASKAALDRMMQNYAAENEDCGIRCNSLSPGPVLTDMGVFASKGQPAGMVTPDKIMPLFWRLLDPDLKDTGKMFDYRDFEGREPIEPWAEFIRAS